MLGGSRRWLEPVHRRFPVPWPSAQRPRTIFNSAFGQRPRKFKGRHRRCDHIIAALYDGAGQMIDACNVIQQLAVMVQKTTIHKIVALDARECRCEVFLAKAGHFCRIGNKRQARTLPLTPRRQQISA